MSSRTCGCDDDTGRRCYAHSVSESYLDEVVDEKLQDRNFKDLSESPKDDFEPATPEQMERLTKIVRNSPKSSEWLDTIFNQIGDMYRSTRTQPVDVQVLDEAKEAIQAHLKLEQLEARLEEVRGFDTRRHYGKDHQESLDELDEYKEQRLSAVQAEINKLEGNNLTNGKNEDYLDE